MPSSWRSLRRLVSNKHAKRVEEALAGSGAGIDRLLCRLQHSGPCPDLPLANPVANDPSPTAQSQHIIGLLPKSQMWPGTPRTDGPNHIGMPSQTIQQPAGAEWLI
jgi:hypothetical protein